MINIRFSGQADKKKIKAVPGTSLLDILKKNGYDVYTPCGGKGRCGKCIVKVTGTGDVVSCNYFPRGDIEITIPGEQEAVIAVHQTEFLEDLPYSRQAVKHLTPHPHGIAIDIGTTTVVMYFLDLLSGKMEKISSFLNPQKRYGGDVITRITFCQENEKGLEELQQAITGGISREILRFSEERKLDPSDIEELIVVGNTTMLHLLLGANPLPIALAPFTPAFTEMQVRDGKDTGLSTNDTGTLITLPCVSAYVGADIVAGLAVLKVPQKRYLFLDIGTNGELALVKDDEILTCATAAGPAFEGANIHCGMAAVNGAISGFSSDGEATVIGNIEPKGICGSGIVDIVAWLLEKGYVDETGLMRDTYNITERVKVIQQDIREIQLAKSAVYSGIKIMLNKAGLEFSDLDALFLAGGFGNYINIDSAIRIGLLPSEMKGRIFAVGNSAGIGALQYLKNDSFRRKTENIMERTSYIELSYIDEFNLEFAMNMNFSLPPSC